jgi:Major intrinsic protein
VLEVSCNPRANLGYFGPAVVATTFGILLIVFSPFSSGSFNPARTLGPAAITGISDDLWIWIFGPLVGALLAAPVHLLLVHGPSKHFDDPALTVRKVSAHKPEDDIPRKLRHHLHHAAQGTTTTTSGPESALVEVPGASQGMPSDTLSDHTVSRQIEGHFS